MAVDFGKRLKEAEDAGYVGGSDYFKLKEGDNRFRLMTECLAHPGEYQGRKNFRWLCYVIDRRDGKVKPFFMAHTIYKQIAALQTNEDYAFYDVPMPYDLNVNAKGAGTKEVEYTLLPAKRETPVKADEFQQLAAAKPLADLQKLLKEKAAGAAHGQSEANPHDLDDPHGQPVTADEVPF